MQSPSDQIIQIKRQQRQQKVALNFKFSCYGKILRRYLPVIFFDFMNPQKRLSEARFSGELEQGLGG
jgi:hypothetical protein